MEIVVLSGHIEFWQMGAEKEQAFEKISDQPNRSKIRYYSVFGSVRFFQENRTEYL